VAQSAEEEKDKGEKKNNEGIFSTKNKHQQQKNNEIRSSKERLISFAWLQHVAFVAESIR
jgi:hypothetical protein